MIPDELERIVSLAVQEMRADKESILKLQADLQSSNDLAVRLQTQVDRLGEELEALKKPGQPPPPPPPIEVSPDIEIRLGATSFRPPLRGDRQGKETRYSGMLFEDVSAVLDIHDEGQVRAFIENRCTSPVPPEGDVENSRLTLRVGGVDRHDADIRLHPHTRPTVVHNPLAPPRVDLAALIASGLVPNYDRGATIPETELVRLAARAGAWDSWDGRGKPYDPVSEEFGLILSSWSGGAGPLLNEAAHLMPAQVVYLLTRDPRAWASVRQLADSSGNYAIHYKIPDDAGGHFPAASETAPLPFLQTPDSVTIRTAAGVECPIPDVAHQHSLCYLAALLTGERYYKEELEAWSSYNVLTRPHNDLRLKGIIWSGQVRAAAWGISALLHCAQVNGGHWAEALVANLNWMRDTFANPKAKDYRPTGVCSVLPFRWAPLLDHVTLTPKPQYIATWNHHIFASVMDECVRAGFDKAAQMRDHVVKVAEGLWHYSASLYEYPWGNHAYPSDNWEDVVRTTFAGRKGLPNGFPPPLTQDYVAWSRAPIVAGVNAGKAWAKEALPKMDQAAAKYKDGLPLVWKINPDTEKAP
jgi:hypothetical protein